MYIKKANTKDKIKRYRWYLEKYSTTAGIQACEQLAHPLTSVKFHNLKVCK